jgi:hypothetical protein
MKQRPKKKKYKESMKQKAGPMKKRDKTGKSE